MYVIDDFKYSQSQKVVVYSAMSGYYFDLFEKGKKIDSGEFQGEPSREKMKAIANAYWGDKKS